MSPSKRIKLGILVPSSNTALEPLTQAIIADLPNVSVHFSRFTVTEIALSSTALAQFHASKIIAAASLLADAKVDCIGWSGTSSGWLGLQADRDLCRQIEAATHIPATTSVLGLCNVLGSIKGSSEEEEDSRARFGLVTPYLDDVQARILETFPAEGYDVVAESHLNRGVNVEFAEIDENILDKQVVEVVSKMGSEKVQVVSTFCTNLRAAHRVVFWEELYPGLIVADTVATVVWQMLKMLAVEYKQLSTRWGKIFQL